MRGDRPGAQRAGRRLPPRVLDRERDRQVEGLGGRRGARPSHRFSGSRPLHFESGQQWADPAGSPLATTPLGKDKTAAVGMSRPDRGRPAFPFSPLGLFPSRSTLPTSPQASGASPSPAPKAQPVLGYPHHLFGQTFTFSYPAAGPGLARWRSEFAVRGLTAVVLDVSPSADGMAAKLAFLPGQEMAATAVTAALIAGEPGAHAVAAP